MELNLYFELRQATSEDLGAIYDSIPFTERLFPEGAPKLSSEQLAIYKGKVEIIPFGRGLVKRILEFVLDLRDLSYINFTLTENGASCVHGMFETIGMEALHDDASAMPAIFLGNIGWIADKLVPRVLPGKMTKGIRRQPLPPEMDYVARYFAKPV